MRTVSLAILLAALCPALVLAQTAPAPAATPPPAPAAAPPPAPAAAPPPAPIAAPPPAGAAPPPAGLTAPPAPAAPPSAYPQQAAPAPQPQQAPAAAPYGYGQQGYYAPPVVDPARERTLAELQALDLSISSVKQEQAQYSLSGPIAMTAAGFGVAVVFGSVSFVEWALAESIEHGDCHYYETHNGFDSSCDLNNDNRIDGDDEHRARVLARTFGALSGAAGVVGILGTVFLMKRMEQRKAYKPRLIELNAHRQQLLQQLRFGGSYGGPTGGLRLSLSGRF